MQWLESTVLHPDGLRRLTVALEVVSENLLEEYREASDTPVVDFFDFMTHQILCLIAQGDHHFAHFRLTYPGRRNKIDDS